MISRIKNYLKRRKEQQTGLYGVVILTLFAFSIACAVVLNIMHSTEAFSMSAYLFFILPYCFLGFVIAKKKLIFPYIKNDDITILCLMIPMTLYLLCTITAKLGYLFNTGERIFFSGLTILFVVLIFLYVQTKTYLKKRKELKEEKRSCHEAKI